MYNLSEKCIMSGSMIFLYVSIVGWIGFLASNLDKDE